MPSITDGHYYLPGWLPQPALCPPHIYFQPNCVRPVIARQKANRPHKA